MCKVITSEEAKNISSNSDMIIYSLMQEDEHGSVLNDGVELCNSLTAEQRNVVFEWMKHIKNYDFAKIAHDSLNLAIKSWNDKTA